MFDKITNPKDLMSKKPILAWISYPQNESYNYCFAYPQWMQDGATIRPIDPSAAPDRGAIYVSIQGGDTAAAIKQKYGEIVVATVNREDIWNQGYGMGDISDQLFAMLNEKWPNSEIEFDRLSTNPLGRELVQVLELENDAISLMTPLSGPVSFKGGEEPVTSMIMIEKTEGYNLTYYGPFSVQPTASGEYELNAVPNHHNMIHKIDSSEAGEILSISRAYGAYGAAAKFIHKPNIVKFLNSPKGRTAIDWMTDEELVEAIANVLKNTRSLNMKRESIRGIKKAIENCTMQEAKIYVTEKRKGRMAELLSKPALWEEQIDVLASALARPEASEKLVEIALSPDYFPQLKKLFTENEDIKQQIEAEKQKYSKEAERARKATEEAIAAKEEAERQLESGLAELKAKEAVILADAKKEREEAERALEETKRELEEAEEGLAVLERQADEIIARLDSDTDKVARKVIRNRVMRKLAGDPIATPSDSTETPQALPKTTAPLPHADEADMKDKQVIEFLHKQISTNANRGMSESEIINLFTCLMGSSITVFSGLPGTGKTSLATIIAGALGLTQPNASRFTKVSVERGWASHRDYIGYYNPLSKTLEASNTEVFAAMTALDAEAREAGTPNGVTDESVPHLFLLDEANLSVMENYWSPFLGNADEFLSTPTMLSMQGGKSLMVPSNTRWIATVNYDHTTEALSERLLNRAWVINMDGDSLSIDDLLDSTGSYDFGSIAPFSYKKLFEVFGPKEDALIEDQAAKKLLVSFFEKCKQAGRPVSYRCQRAVARYVATAQPLMDAFEESAGAQAVDFALAQRVLPSINGVGDGVRSLLEELRNISPALKRTNARIDRMIQAGDADGFYQFFV